MLRPKDKRSNLSYNWLQLAQSLMQSFFYNYKYTIFTFCFFIISNSIFPHIVPNDFLRTHKCKIHEFFMSVFDNHRFNSNFIALSFKAYQNFSNNRRLTVLMTGTISTTDNCIYMVGLSNIVSIQATDI